jgi:hypothetical protein
MARLFIAISGALGLLVGSFSPSARADGMLLAPGYMLRHFAEQSQIAVVEVERDRTARVDLFISLLDTSGESHEVRFLLPLQTMPGEFGAEELSVWEFRRSRIDPLDTVFFVAAAEARRHRRAMGNAFALGAVLACPGGTVAARLVFPVFARDSIQTAGAAHMGVPVAALTVTTEHTRAEVFDQLAPEELAALAELPELPDTVREALGGYVGKPFALVRLRTVPRGGSGPGDADEPTPEGPEEEPGIVFSFTQEMLPAEGALAYEYPLGTGAGWEQPIPVTQVYVTAPEDMPLEVEFPERPRGEAPLEMKGAGLRRDESIAYAAEGRQVHFASYMHSNPSEDVSVRALEAGVSEFAVAARQRARGRALAWIAFPTLGLVAWLASFGIIVWPDRRSKAFGMWRALGTSWAVGFAIMLVPLAGLWPAALAFGDVVFFTLLMVALVVAGIVYAVQRMMKVDFAVFAARAVAATLVAGAAYLVVGLKIQQWLAK